MGSKITADSDCSHEIKRLLLLGRKAIIKLDSILKSRGITLQTKIHIVKAMVFLREGMATYSSVFAWRNPWTEEAGRLQSMESKRAGHN